MAKNVVKFEEIPKNILGFLLKIENTTYFVINNHLNDNTRTFIIEALHYYKYEELAKITITDIQKNTNAIQYANEKGLKLNDRLYEYS